MEKVIINPSLGGSESGNIRGSLIEKNYNLEIARKIRDYLTNNGIETYLVRDSDITLTNQQRLNIIEDLIDPGDHVILLTTMLSSGDDSGSEIIYALRDTDKLSRIISDNIKDTGINVLKYYQLRDQTDTSLDFYEIIREPENTESLIVSFGYVDNSFDNSFLINNQGLLADAVGESLVDYIKGENIYIVKSGDTLYSIAARFNTTVARLKEVNNLGSNSLTIGQELIIPESEEDDDSNIEPPTSGEYIRYTVKPGDSLYKIAKNYNTTVNALIEVNNLTSNTLSIGQVLNIPTNGDTNGNYINYTVKSGDSLYKIANSYNTTVNEIVSLNNLSSTLLSIGQVLRIPTTNNNTTNNYINYRVKSGDSLYKIANSYNTTVNEIKSLNNLTSNNLSIGQVLKIPIN
ncbi:MAG: LysM peptidoglycan-binding domain-containing protein [Bacilli bacterium]|nr:LysM peptidoglycan-binding domain-containing protein [Bacilli bacterium]